MFTNLNVLHQAWTGVSIARSMRVMALPLGIDFDEFAGLTPTDGILPTAADFAEEEGIPRSPRVLELASRMDNFGEKLPEIPASDDARYGPAVEKQSELIFKWAKEQAKKLFKEDSAAIDVIFNVLSFKGIGGTMYTTAVNKIAAVLARGKYVGFWDAVLLKVQQKRDLDQQLPDIGIKPAEAEELRESLRKAKVAAAKFSRKTATKSYNRSTSFIQKKYDQYISEQYIIENTSELAKIVRLSVNDVPLGFAPAEVFAFQLDANPTTKKALVAKLTELQKQAVIQWRKNPNAFDLETYLNVVKL